MTEVSLVHPVYVIGVVLHERIPLEVVDPVRGRLEAGADQGVEQGTRLVEVEVAQSLTCGSIFGMIFVCSTFVIVFYIEFRVHFLYTTGKNRGAPLYNS